MSDETESQMKKAFDTFDMDKNGSISTKEIHIVLNMCGVKISQIQSANLIQKYDANESGSLEFSEFRALFNEARNQHKEK